MRKRNFFATRRGIITVGAIIGVLAPVLQKMGNPGNMGICVACFERDIAGAIGFLAQRSRFCTMGALRDLILFKHVHLFSGFVQREL